MNTQEQPTESNLDLYGLRYGYAFADALAILERFDIETEKVHQTPQTLRLGDIKRAEAVFQARAGALSEPHLNELRQALRSTPTLEPVTVWRCGPYAFLIDGHHRYEAYRRRAAELGTEIDVPVYWFKGTAKEAAVEAGKANSRAKLPLRQEEKSNHAWRMVVAGGFKNREVMAAASVSKRNVTNMRNAKVKCEAEGIDTGGSWGYVSGRLRGQMNREWDEDQVEMRAAKMANSLTRHMGKHLFLSAEITARALDIVFGRRSHEIIEEWQPIAEMPDDRWIDPDDVDPNPDTLCHDLNPDF